MHHKNSPVELSWREKSENPPNGHVPPGTKVQQSTKDEQEAVMCGLLEELEAGQ